MEESVAAEVHENPDAEAASVSGENAIAEQESGGKRPETESGTGHLSGTKATVAAETTVANSEGAGTKPEGTNAATAAPAQTPTAAPTTAASTQATTTEAIKYGNSGMAFDTLEEAEEWGFSYLESHPELDTVYSGFYMWQMSNEKYTVDFY
ncbi:hypothetical protein QJ036_05320 [Ruminococcus sp. YH-rum2234]|uniref:Uncharacterized protein n=2 Tax=Fusibacillus kribbianus TaxID=3044208 RepID=A0AAP4EWV8_9FIRM|nr:hypothetical protein [Ruminococcus sp. YH-rum2234]